MISDPKRDGPAAQRFAKLDGQRHGIMDIARECASLTIPSILPPIGYTEGTVLAQPAQSKGSAGVNSLAAKMVTALFPPSSSLVTLEPSEADLLEIQRLIDSGLGEQVGLSGTFEEVRAGIVGSLQDVERQIQQEFESRALRDPILEGIRHSIVVGVGTLYIPEDGPARGYALSNVVMRRDGAGRLQELILRDSVDPNDLPEDLRHEVEVTTSDSSVHKSEQIELYTWVKYGPDGWYTSHQETKAGTLVQGSEGRHKPNDLPWIIIPWRRADGTDYAHSHVEDNIGLLRSLEGQTRALDAASALAVSKRFLQKPGFTNTKDVEEAENGAIIPGDAEEFSVLGFENIREIQTILSIVERLEREVGIAFVNVQSIQRQGERVTAEEIKAMADELESVLGGVYSAFAVSLQKALVYRLLFILRRRGDVPTLPDSVKVIIRTGLDGLSRAKDLNQLSWLLEVIAPHPQMMQRLKAGEFLNRLTTAAEIPVKGLFKTDDEIAAENNQQSQMEMLGKLGPGVASNLTKSLMEPEQ